MKKLLLIAILMLALVFTVVACNNDPVVEDTTADTTVAEDPTEAPTAEPTDEPTAELDTATGIIVVDLFKRLIADYGMSVKRLPTLRHNPYPPTDSFDEGGCVIPFGDGPRPIYPHRIAKTLIKRMLETAMRYVYITTPYLIIDNELCAALEGAAARGVDVRIVLPHIPDKKLVFLMSRSYYKRLIDAGIRIYEYTPGFIHAKCYLADDEIAMVGTVNLDYRSLVHHFENGVYMYRTACIADIRRDLEDTMQKSALIPQDKGKRPLRERFWSSLVRIFAPLM